MLSIAQFPHYVDGNQALLELKNLWVGYKEYLEWENRRTLRLTLLLSQHLKQQLKPLRALAPKQLLQSELV
jgi:hypothetical protein